MNLILQIKLTSIKNNIPYKKSIFNTINGIENTFFYKSLIISTYIFLIKIALNTNATISANGNAHQTRCLYFLT